MQASLLVFLVSAYPSLPESLALFFAVNKRLNGPQL
jgi:hypothetical protein